MYDIMMESGVYARTLLYVSTINLDALMLQQHTR